MRLPSTAGTTASVIFIKNNKYYIGHVGDSRIVIARENPSTRNWISHDLTVDHKPDSDEELRRIEDSGGKVRPKAGVYRVVWQRPVLRANIEIKSSEYRFPIPEELVSHYVEVPFLAIGRSLGDFWSYNPKTEKYVVSPEPDVYSEPVDLNDKGIILASDGLWNVMHSALAVRILQQFSRRDLDLSDELRGYQDIDNYYNLTYNLGENSAQALVDVAYQMWEWRKLKSDNITAIVVRFNDESVKAVIRNDSEVCTECFCRTSPQGIVNRSFLESLEKPLQITRTSKTYYEPIQFGKLPDLVGHMDYKGRAKMLYSPSFYNIRLPPSITRLEAPKNYQRLSQSNYRIIIASHTKKLRILIAHVTDDPVDLCEKKTRINSNKKVVSDSSCQATQPLHDFGQPWHALMSKCTGVKGDFYDSDDDGLLPRKVEISRLLDPFDRNEISEVAKNLYGDYPDFVICDSPISPPSQSNEDCSKSPNYSPKTTSQPKDIEYERHPLVFYTKKRCLAMSDDENRVSSAIKTRNQSSINSKELYEPSKMKSPSYSTMKLRSRKSCDSHEPTLRSFNCTHPLLAIPKTNHKIIRRTKSWQSRASDKVRKIRRFTSSASIFLRRSSRKTACKTKKR